MYVHPSALANDSDEICQLMGKIQKHNFDAHGHYYRGTHVRLFLVRIEID